MGSSTAGRKRIAVIFGGTSSEHAVSCVSAGSVLAHLDATKYEAVPVGIARNGTWVAGTSDTASLAFGPTGLPEVAADATPLALVATGGDPGHSPAARLVTLSDGAPAAGAVLAGVDAVFPLLHGPYGEDGTIQGMLELVGVPYVGAGVLASAAGMDKEFTKKLLTAAGLPVADCVVLRRGDTGDADAIVAKLGLPLFVKPARGGSSIGISRVDDAANLPAAISAARDHDPKVLIEGAVVGREVEIGVLEFPDGTLRTSVISEIIVPEDDAHTFYDFETKYLDDRAQYDIPAHLPAEVAAEISRLATEAFTAIDAKGLARIDFFVTAAGPVINEVNTMPGFTSTSMYPKMWAETGVSYPELLSILLETAIAGGIGLR